MDIDNMSEEEKEKMKLKMVYTNVRKRVVDECGFNLTSELNKDLWSLVEAYIFFTKKEYKAALKPLNGQIKEFSHPVSRFLRVICYYEQKYEFSKYIEHALNDLNVAQSHLKKLESRYSSDNGKYVSSVFKVILEPIYDRKFFEDDEDRTPEEVYSFFESMLLRTRAGIHYKLKDIRKSLKDYEDSLDLEDEYNDLAIHGKGCCFLELGRFQEAIKSFSQCIEKNKKDWKSLTSRGYAYMKLRLSSQALNDFNEALRLNPDDHHAMNNRGKIYQQLGLYDYAKRDFLHSLEQEPNSDEYVSNLADLLESNFKKGETKKKKVEEEEKKNKKKKKKDEEPTTTKTTTKTITDFCEKIFIHHPPKKIDDLRFQKDGLSDEEIEKREIERIKNVVKGHFSEVEVEFEKIFKIVRLLQCRHEDEKTYLCKIQDVKDKYFIMKVLTWKRLPGSSTYDDKRDFLQVMPYHRNLVTILSNKTYDVHDDQEKSNFPSIVKKNKDFCEILLMRYYPKTLKEYVIQRRMTGLPFTSLEVCYMIHGLLQGIHHLKLNNVVHRDLHKETIFVDEKSGRIVIGDFGFSINQFKVKKKTMKRKGGSESTLAPEILDTESENVALDYTKNDLFSVGMIGYYLVSAFVGRGLTAPFGLRYVKFKGRKNFAVAKTKNRNQGEFVSLSKFKNCDEKLTTFLDGLLKIDPKERTSLEDAILEIKRLIEHFEKTKSEQKKQEKEEEEEEGEEEETEVKKQKTKKGTVPVSIKSKLSEEERLRKESDAMSFANRASTYFSKGDFENTVKFCSKAISIKPDFVRAYFTRASAYASMKKKKEAIEDVDTTIEIYKKQGGENVDIDVGRAHRIRGQVLLVQDRFDDSLAEFSKSVKLNPSDWECYKMRGILLQQLGRWKESIQDFEKVLKIYPQDGESRERLNQSKLRLTIDSGGKSNVMIQDPSIEKLSPEQRRIYLEMCDKGKKFLKLKKVDEALEMFNSALEINSEDPELYLSLGATYHEKKDLKKAVDMFSQCLKIDPTYYQAYVSRANVFKDMGQYMPMIKDMEMYKKYLGEAEKKFEMLQKMKKMEDEKIAENKGEKKCSSCGKLGAKKVCARCKSCFYCSRECQLKHWKVHKKKCRKK